METEVCVLFCRYQGHSELQRSHEAVSFYSIWIHNYLCACLYVKVCVCVLIHSWYHLQYIVLSTRKLCYTYSIKIINFIKNITHTNACIHARTCTQSHTHTHLFKRWFLMENVPFLGLRLIFYSYFMKLLFLY